jgi:hypothetical protein
MGPGVDCKGIASAMHIVVLIPWDASGGISWIVERHLHMTAGTGEAVSATDKAQVSCANAYTGRRPDWMLDLVGVHT